VVVRSGRDEGGSKGVSSMAARIFDLEKGDHLFVSVSGKPSASGVLCNRITTTEEDGAAVVLEDNDGFDKIEGMDGCKGKSAAGALCFVELLKNIRGLHAWAVLRAETDFDAGKSKKGKSRYGVFYEIREKAA